MRKLLLLISSAFISNTVLSQSLPSEMYYSADGKVLFTGGVLPAGWYDKDSIRSVYINFPQSNWWTLLTNNYASETEIPATMVVNGVSYDSVGVRFRGNTSYTQIGSSQKKSFAVTLDFVHEDQKIMGYKNLKFNNAHQDASFMREVLYNRMARKYMPIAKGSYIHLYLNGEDWGIYPNVQSVDKTFLEEWFLSNDGARFRATNEETGTPGGGWGDGTAGMNYLGDDTTAYQQYYDLKSSDIDDPWTKLVAACSTLNAATNANKETTKQQLDVDKALWFLAAENIFADDDGYVMKGKMDYYVYYEPETGRTTPLEYDGNSSFLTSAATSTSWGPFKNVTNANYPLLNKFLTIPEWRQRYLAHYRTILNETFTTTNANTIIDSLNGQISALVNSDTKKLYTYAQYTSAIPALKNFVSNRRTYLLGNTEVAQVAPVIASAPFYNKTMVEYEVPEANDTANIKATVSSTTGISKVNLYYGSGVVGNFTAVQMFDDGVHNDGTAGDGVYGASIPGFAANTLVRYYVEAIANNAALSASYLPAGAEHDIFVYKVAEPAAVSNGVVVNELLASNSLDATDEAGDHEDWIELYNNNTTDVDLSGYYLTDDSTNLAKWQIPTGTVIPARAYLIFWADDEASEGPLHTNFKLSASGESVVLSNSLLQIIDKVPFGAQSANIAYARVPNGTGDFLNQLSTFNYSNDSLQVLSVSILSFSGYKSGTANVLLWTTIQEINNTGFAIERSADGINFTEISFVNTLATNGNSSTQLQYNFTDINTTGNKQYYRLRQTGINGRINYSAIILINAVKPSVLTAGAVYPNPATSQVTLVLYVPAPENTSIVVMDATGRIVHKQTAAVNTGTNNILIETARLAPGNYLIKVFCGTDGCETAVQKFVKH